jgi:hypothetical protein
MSQSNNKGQTDRLQSGSKVLPPFKVAASTWDSELGPCSTGRFIGVGNVLPPVKGEMDSAPEIFLELAIRLAADALDWKVFVSVGQMIDCLDAREKSLGGAGVAWEKDRSKVEPGCLTLVLSARTGFGAQERFVELVKHAADTVNTAVAVAEVHAKVYRAGRNGESEMVCELHHGDAA